MGTFWLLFGLIATFYPAAMNLYQTEAGIQAVTPYSNHIWQHDGFDILSVSILLFALSRASASRIMLRASAIVALLVFIAIVSSMTTTPYWNSMFITPGLCCLGFSVWGFRLSTKAS